MLTEQELNKIFSWLPYREDWPVDRNQIDDNISSYFADVIRSLTQNKLFDTYYSQDGGLTNYLEFICYPLGYKDYDGPAIMVCVSVCAPIAIYGQIDSHKTEKSRGWNFIKPEMIGVVTDIALKDIENEIVSILERNQLTLIDKQFANKPLPKEMAEHIKQWSLNDGNLYLHGIFQFTD